MVTPASPEVLMSSGKPTREKKPPAILRGPGALWVAGSLVGLILVMALWPQLFTGFGHGPLENCDISRRNEPPSSDHWFGRDVQGCDYYTNVIYGARTSVIIGLVVTAVTFIIATILGALAGYYGGWIDTLVSRTVDIFFGLPFILAAIVILQLFEARTIWTVAFALAAFSWPGGVRFMRASVLSIREREYVTAARTLGASDYRIMKEHVVPNSLTPLLVLQTLGVGGAIAAEAGLTFIGVGLAPPAVSWGLQLANSQSFLSLAPHLIVFPALFLTFTVLSFVVFGEALRDTLDPKE